MNRQKDTDPAERSGKGLIVMLVIYFSGDTSLSMSALIDDGSLGPMGSVRSHRWERVWPDEVPLQIHLIPIMMLSG